MRVKLNTIMAGPGGVHHPGDEIRVSQEVGKALLAGMFASRADGKPPLETTAAPPPAETASPRDKRPAVSAPPQPAEAAADEPAAVADEWTAGSPAAIAEADAEVDPASVEELVAHGMPDHLVGKLEAAGLATVDAVRTCEDLDALKGIGATYTEKIIDALDSFDAA